VDVGTPAQYDVAAGATKHAAQKTKKNLAAY
jgi:hypothetical protein